MSDSIEVQVGQVWADNDWRSSSREHLRVVAIEDTHAVVERLNGTRRTRIRLDRFKPTSTGYRLISEATR